MDLVADALADGRRFRSLTIVDHFSRESVAIEVGASLTGQHVVEVLRRLNRLGRRPRWIIVDNGFEFISKVLDQWAHWHVTLLVRLGGAGRGDARVASFSPSSSKGAWPGSGTPTACIPIGTVEETQAVFSNLGHSSDFWRLDSWNVIH